MNTYSDLITFLSFADPVSEEPVDLADAYVLPKPAIITRMVWIQFALPVAVWVLLPQGIMMDVLSTMRSEAESRRPMCVCLLSPCTVH